MKKVLLTIGWFVVLPLIASAIIMSLWNAIIPSLTGFATVDFISALGLFLLGQFITGGFAIGLFLLGGILHLAGAHHNRLSHERWSNMSEAERMEFFRSRRFRFDHNADKSDKTKASSDTKDS